MFLSVPLEEGINWMNIVFVLIGIAVICVLRIAANFVFKLTMKVFALGCLGIVVLGMICAGVAYLGGGQ